MTHDNNNLLNGSPDKKEEEVKKIGILGRIAHFVTRKGMDNRGNDSEGNGSDVNFIGSNFAAAPMRETRNKFIFLGMVLFCNIAVVALIYAALAVKGNMSSGNLENLENEKAQIEKEILELKEYESEMAQLRNNIDSAGRFLDEHIYWDELFEIMEAHTVLGVRYETFNIDNAGQLKLDAVAENFEILSQQIAEFYKASDYFSNVEMSSISVDQDKKTGKVGGIKFFISMNLDADIFYKKE